jgi:hypothetical protein
MHHRAGFCKLGNTDAKSFRDLPVRYGGCGEGIKYNVQLMKPRKVNIPLYRWQEVE